MLLCFSLFLQSSKKMTDNNVLATIKFCEGIALTEIWGLHIGQIKTSKTYSFHLCQSSYPFIDLKDVQNLIFLSTAWQQKIAMVKPAIRKKVKKVQVFGHVKSII